MKITKRKTKIGLFHEIEISGKIWYIAIEILPLLGFPYRITNELRNVPAQDKFIIVGGYPMEELRNSEVVSAHARKIILITGSAVLDLARKRNNIETIVKLAKIIK